MCFFKTSSNIIAINNFFIIPSFCCVYVFKALCNSLQFILNYSLNQEGNRKKYVRVQGLPKQLVTGSKFENLKMSIIREFHLKIHCLNRIMVEISSMEML